MIMTVYATTRANRLRGTVLRYPLLMLRMIVRRSARLQVLAAAIFMLAAFFLVGTPCRAQYGFTVFGGGTVPAGEFGKTDLDRDPPKSGAENGHSFGGGAVWRIMTAERHHSGLGIHPDIILSMVFAESEFGNDVPRVLSYDTMQFVTPESRIRWRGFRAGLRVVPWAHRIVSPSLGGGFQTGKMTVESRAFFGLGENAVGTDEPLALQITSKSENVSGVFAQLGLAARSGEEALFFVDAVFHHLFSDGVKSTTEFKPSADPPSEGEIKSNFQWWELRAGLAWFF